MNETHGMMRLLSNCFNLFKSRESVLVQLEQEYIPEQQKGCQDISEIEMCNRKESMIRNRIKLVDCCGFEFCHDSIDDRAGTCTTMRITFLRSRRKLLIIIALYVTVVVAKLNCLDLSNFDVTCSADAVSGIQVSGSKGGSRPDDIQLGESSLRTLHTSDNGCSLLIERQYLDIQQNKEIKYTMACFLPDQFNEVEYFGEWDDAAVEEFSFSYDHRWDDDRLVCNNNGFELPDEVSNVHVEINGDLENNDGGEVYVSGTFSSSNHIGSWTGSCNPV